MEKGAVERFNEWWFTGKIRRELALPFKRHAFSRILNSLKERQILIITGLRRVGKTTLLYQAIEKLLEEGEDARRVLYFSFEDLEANPREVLDFYERRVLRKPFEEAGKIYIFLDEIQYCEEWSSVIKQYYDLYPNLKFFLSGSSSLLLSREALDRLAGRFFFFELRPLSFFEFLEMRGIKTSEPELFSRRIEAQFFEYLRKAGFPEIVDWEDEEKIADYIKNSVMDRVIFKDLPTIFKTRDLLLLEKIMKMIVSNPGGILNLNSLSRDLGASKITISNYLKLLEVSLLIRCLSNFRPSFLSASRKLKKYYPSTTSLIFSNSREVFEKNFGAVLETYVVNALNASLYFRDGKREVDIILKNGKIVPIEVKEKVVESDLKKFSKLLGYINAKNGIVVSLNQKFKEGKIEVIPAYLVEELAQAHSRNSK